MKERAHFTKVYFTVFIVLLTFGEPGKALGYNPPEDKIFESMPLGKFLYYIEDLNGELSFEEISDPDFDDNWIKSEEHAPSFGQTTSHFWLKLDLTQTGLSGTSKDLVLELDYPWMNNIEYYRSENGKFHKEEYGSLRPFHDRPQNHKSFLFNLSKDADKHIYYFKISSLSSMYFPLKLWEKGALYNATSNKAMLFGFFVGALLIMVFYNLMIYFSIREKAYIYYVAYVFSFLMLCLMIEGYGYKYLWPEAVFWNDKSVILFVSLSSIFLLLFTNNFLDSKLHVPYIERFTSVLVLLASLIAIINFFVYSNYSSISMLTLVFLVCIVVMVQAVKGALNNYRPAKFYLMAWSALIVFILMYSLRSIGLIESNQLTENGLYIGLTIQVALISIALGDKIQTLSKEKEQAQKKLIHALQSEEEKDTLIGVVSHDLKSPLNQIKGLVNLMMVNKAKLDREDLTYLDLINKTAERLLNMVRRLLDLNALETKSISFNMERVDIGHEMASVVDGLLSQAKSKKIKIHSDFGVGEHYVNLDKNCLTHVFENVLSNALKFSERGKNIFVKIYNEKDKVITVIKDEGPGITPEDMEKLFGKFQKLSARPTAGESSSGLGLSISKKYTEEMGGTIACESQPGQGASFIISFKGV